MLLKPTEVVSIYDNPKPIPPEIVKGLIHQGCSMSIGGSSKTYKSWVSQDLAVSVAADALWLGMSVTKSRVLYINFEIDDPFVEERFRQIIAAKGLKREDVEAYLDILTITEDEMDGKKLEDSLVESFKKGRYFLIIVDPVYKLLTDDDENSTKSINRCLSALRRVAKKLNVAMVYCAHFSKGNQSEKRPIDRISGSGVFGRHADTVMTITEHEEPGAFVIEATQRNHAEFPMFVVQWEFPLMHRNEDLDPTKLKKTTTKAKKADPEKLLDLLGENGLTNTEWQERTQKKLKVSKGTYYNYRDELIGRNLAYEEKGRYYAFNGHTN